MNKLELIELEAKAMLETAWKDYGDDLYVAFTGGKDSTVVLHLFKSFTKKLPKLFCIDTGDMFEELRDFISELSKEWELDITWVKNPKKVEAINEFIKTTKAKALVIGIRRDEHEARANENYAVVKKDHVRIHPILDFTEDNIWEYIKKYDIPYCRLYDEGYRSLGEKSKTKKVNTDGKERGGREVEKEEIMRALRKQGYF